MLTKDAKNVSSGEIHYFQNQNIFQWNKIQKHVKVILINTFGGVVMANSCLVQVKIDAETKTDVTNIYESLGLDLPTAIRIFFKKSIAVGGLPFELRNDSISERWTVYNEARKSMQKNNVPEMSIDEINAEIAAARAEK